MTRTAVLGLLLLIAVGGYLFQHYRPRPPAPDFALRTTDGREVRLEDHYGHVLVLDFWASWCPPCRASIPAIDRLYAKYRDRGVMVYGVQIRDEVDPAKYLADRGADYPALIGTDAVQRAFDVVSIPTIVIIGVDGSIVHRSSGWSSSDEAKIDRVLGNYLAQVGMN